VNPPFARSEDPAPPHALDARTKIVLALAYTLAVMAVPFGDPLPLVPLALPLAFAVGAGGVPLRRLASRLLLGLPFVGLVIAFPLLLDRRPLPVEIAGLRVPLTEGALRSGTLAGKYVLAFGAAVALAATTGVPEVARALARLGSPAVFVDTVSLLWRYLGLLSEEAGRMRRARESRTAGAPGLALAWRSSGALLGNLFRRALARSARVQAALEARGFAGAFPALRRERLRAADWAALAAGTLYFGACLALVWIRIDHARIA
jgi:cobalt/nickel transport system permease protein